MLLVLPPLPPFKIYLHNILILFMRYWGSPEPQEVEEMPPSSF